MPRLFSRLPVSLHSRAFKALVFLAAICALFAIVQFLVFSETTETTGHLWWKETREIPYSERRPYILACIGLAATAVVLLLGALELVVARTIQRRAEQRRLRDAEEAQRLWETSAAGHAHRQALAAAEQRRRELEAAERAEREAQKAQRLWERSTAGQAELAYQQGDQFFSIELVVDGDLARHLNDVSKAGWHQESVGRRHERITSKEARYDGTRITRETVEIRTYLFRRAP